MRSRHGQGFRPRSVVLTGGPCAGRTAVLELARRNFHQRIDVLPESASIAFGGGFPRRNGEAERRAAQRAIYRVQVELESVAEAAAMASSSQGERLKGLLCDRGTVDGLAYWPGDAASFFGHVGSTMQDELARYDAVIHLRVPCDPRAYHLSAIRGESHQDARALDAKLLEVWSAHPNRTIIDGTRDFLEKSERAPVAISEALGVGYGRESSLPPPLEP